MNNILSLLQEQGLTPIRVASSWGGTYASPCPSCGGTDRFRAFPNNPSGIQWLCQKCSPTGGDLVAYMIQFRGMSAAGACKLLGISPDRRPSKVVSIRAPRDQTLWTPGESILPPCAAWQDMGRGCVDIAQDTLWSQAVLKEIRTWLASRGLHEKTLKAARIGFVHPEKSYLRTEWGLPRKESDGLVVDRLHIPSGLLIPYEEGGHLLRIKIRLFASDAPQKYLLVEGSAMVPMIWNGPDVFLVVESELDGLLLHQEAGDLVSIIALGSAQIRPDVELTNRLRGSSGILVALDSDDAGGRSSQWWCSHFTNALRWPVPRGNDPTEALQEGLDLGAWVYAGIHNLRGNGHPANHQEPCIEISSHEMPATVPFEHVLVTDSRALRDEVEKLGHPEHLGIHTDEHRIYLGIPGHPVLIIDPGEISDIDPLKQWLGQPGETVVVHDGKTVLKTLSGLGIIMDGVAFDIGIASHMLNAGRTPQEHESTRLLPSKETDRHEQRGPLDPRDLLPIRDRLTSELESAGLLNVAKLECACTPVVVQMESTGILIDAAKAETQVRTFLETKENIELKFRAAGIDANLDSNADVLALLRERGLHLENTREDTLLGSQEEYPIVRDILRYRHAATRWHFAKSLIQHRDPHTGRIHPEYLQLGAVTGRFSCRNPNLQQTPRDPAIRALFVPTPGYRLVIADYSQIEIRVAAEISRDTRMIKAFQEGHDLHTLTASLVTGKSLDDISKDERRMAKAVNFGLIFGMGSDGLRRYAQTAYGVVMTQEDSRRFRERFFDAYAGIAAWHETVSGSGSIETRTILDRRRLWDREPKITELLNTPIQGTAADIMKLALIGVHRQLSGTTASIVGCVHDELIVEVEQDESTEVAGVVRDGMTRAGQLILKTVPVIVDVSIARDWDRGGVSITS